MENQENQQHQDLPLDDNWLNEILEETNTEDEVLSDVEAIVEEVTSTPEDDIALLDRKSVV